MKTFIEIEVDPSTCSIRHRDGWSGSAFTTDEHPNARFKNESRVFKVREDEGGDITPLGSAGTVLGSIAYPGAPYCGYFVTWDRKPRFVTFMVEWKIARL